MGMSPVSRYQMGVTGAGDPFLVGPEKLSYPESRGKISSLIFTQLSCLHIFNMNRGSLRIP